MDFMGTTLWTHVTTNSDTECIYFFEDTSKFSLLKYDTTTQTTSALYSQVTVEWILD